jgi:hypothetical protein
MSVLKTNVRANPLRFSKILGVQSLFDTMVECYMHEQHEDLASNSSDDLTAHAKIARAESNDSISSPGLSKATGQASIDERSLDTFNHKATGVLYIREGGPLPSNAPQAKKILLRRAIGQLEHGDRSSQELTQEQRTILRQEIITMIILIIRDCATEVRKRYLMRVWCLLTIARILRREIRYTHSN